jgi:hypothetical protein
MRVFLINPSDIAFGIGVITPRWLFVLAGATPDRYGEPIIIDETVAGMDPTNLNRETLLASAFTRPTR